MIAMRRQISFKQLNPIKPAKYGMLYKSINICRYPFTVPFQLLCVVNVGTTTIRVPNLLMRSCLCLRALQSVALSALCKQLACCSNHGCSAMRVS